MLTIMNAILLHMYSLLCEFCRCLQHCIEIIGLWEWLIVGVVLTNNLTIKSNLGELSPSSSGGSAAL